jgi:hypothetical protein
MINFFFYFQAHRSVPPATSVVELWEKQYFAMKTKWRASKMDESTPWDLL